MENNIRKLPHNDSSVFNQNSSIIHRTPYKHPVIEKAELAAQQASQMAANVSSLINKQNPMSSDNSSSRQQDGSSRKLLIKKDSMGYSSNIAGIGQQIIGGNGSSRFENQDLISNNKVKAFTPSKFEIKKYFDKSLTKEEQQLLNDFPDDSSLKSRPHPQIHRSATKSNQKSLPPRLRIDKGYSREDNNYSEFQYKQQHSQSMINDSQILNQTRVEDNAGADQNINNLEEIPSDLSIDLDHQGVDSDDMDYDEPQIPKDLSQEGQQKPKNLDHSVLSIGKLEYLDQINPHDKVSDFIQNNPLCHTFIRKEKARLPYSVFKPHAETIYFIKSIFDKRPPTAFFPYPRYCKTKRESERIRQYDREDIEYLFMAFRINDSTHIYNAVVNSFKNAGFQLIENSSFWNVLWTGYTKTEDIKDLNKYQRVNHFPGSIQLGRKDMLWKNMFRLKQKYGKEYDITPMTYLFPEDYNRFEHDREREDALYILKPVAASCGRGIKVIGKKTKITKRDGYLASKYVSKPHLINGFKYDLRVYVLVTSYDPLRIYVYNEGLVRFATEKYTLNPNDLKKRFVHLTNFSVNKRNENFVQNKNQEEGEENSSKWSFKMLRKAYETIGINYDFVFSQIKDVIVKTLISVEPHIVSNLNKCPGNRTTCFELYGFDILVDKKLKPWLLEVNVLPSLSSSSPFDKTVKTLLICDILTIIGIRGYDKKKVHLQTEEDKKQLSKYIDDSQLDLEEIKTMTIEQIQDLRILKGNESLSPDEINMLIDHEEEFSRKGGFSRVFPLAANVDYYEKFFECKRYYNNLLWAYIRGGHPAQQVITKHYKRVYTSSL